MKRVKQWLKAANSYLERSPGALFVTKWGVTFLGIVISAVAIEGLDSPRVFAQSVFTAEAARKQLAEDATWNARCKNPGDLGAWLVPGSIYRVELGKPTIDPRPSIASVMTQIGACYNIRSVTATTHSETTWIEQVGGGRMPITSVWNDSLILVIERKR